MESLAHHTALFMMSYRIQMVEESISFWTSCQLPESQTSSGWLAYIDVMALLTNWSYLGHYPPEPNPFKQPSSSMPNMELHPTDMLTLSTCVPGHQTTAAASLYRDSTSNDEVDQVDPGDPSKRSASSICSSICCVPPGGCVYLKSDMPPSTSHLLQVSYFW